MMYQIEELIGKLEREHSLTSSEYKLILSNSSDAAPILTKKAVQTRCKIYGNDIYIRGLIEIGNICKNNCYYCGIRADNRKCERYRLAPDDVIDCCQQGYRLGFRTFVMQGGEDKYFTDDLLCNIISMIKQNYHDCAITLSLGERSRESYKKLHEAGADRYLLRHETADKDHYEKLHPSTLSFDNRMKCLYTLKELGYQVGCGFMVGSPYQTTETLIKDLKFIESFQPDMCGIGPFIPHKDTPFINESAGTLELTCLLLSIIRLIKPNILLPSTTALGTIDPNGREKGILSGANVIMPNLSPTNVRKKYMLYDNKISDGDEAAESIASIKKRMTAIGYNIVIDRGDIK